MDIDAMLEALKVDLGISTNAYDARLTQYLNAAGKAIETEGITLDLQNYQDSMLQIMYAAWLWRKRDSQDGMPRMLRWLMNNRLFSEKVKEQ